MSEVLAQLQKKGGGSGETEIKIIYSGIAYSTANVILTEDYPNGFYIADSDKRQYLPSLNLTRGGGSEVNIDSYRTNITIAQGSEDNTGVRIDKLDYDLKVGDKIRCYSGAGGGTKFVMFTFGKA